MDDRIDLGGLDVNGSGLTLAAWFRADSFPGPSADPRLISKASGVNDSEHIFMLSTIQAGSNMRLRARLRTGGTTTTLIASSGNLSTGQWYHAAMTYDGSTLRLYLDGVQVGSMGLTGTVVTNPGVNVSVGGQPAGAGGRNFHGRIDDARILERALTAEEVLAIVEGPQTPVVAIDDDYETEEDTLLSVSAAEGVLANDLNPEGSELTALLESGVTNGELSLNPDGSFTYQPDAGYFGQDSFTYRAYDGVGASNAALVRIVVTGVNRAPVAVDDSYQVLPGATLTVNAAQGVLANDSDPNGDALTAVLVGGVSHGTLSLNPDGSFTYTPQAGFEGEDGFTYQASDGELLSNTASVTITVSDAGDPAVVVWLPLDEGSGTVAGDISGRGNHGSLVNGASFASGSGDGSPFSVQFDGVNDRIDLGGLDVNGSGLTLAAWFRADSFPGPSSDPRLISKASGLNDPEHIFMLSTIQVGSNVRLRARVRTGGTTTTLVASSGNLSIGQWYHAAMTYDGSTLRLYLDGVQVGSMGLTGTVATNPAVNVSVGGQPAGAGGRNFHGRIDDARILERALTAEEVIEIVEGPQTPVVAIDDEYETEEDTLLAVSAAEGVLANDLNPEGSDLTALLESDVSNGSLNLNPDGSFSYQPEAGYLWAGQLHVPGSRRGRGFECGPGADRGDGGQPGAGGGR
jgi:VCBS repeat-containing protein